jgi:hypothetical protein
VPSLPANNNDYFNVLAVEELKNDSSASTDTSLKTHKPILQQLGRPKWEHHLPEKLEIDAAEPGSSSLYLQIEIESTETQQKQGICMLVDWAFHRQRICQVELLAN